MNRRLLPKIKFKNRKLRRGLKKRGRLSLNKFSIQTRSVKKQDGNRTIEHDCLSKFLGFLKNLKPKAQLELWESIILNHPFNLQQFISLYTAIDHRMKFDIVSNVPYEIALYIMSFLEPKDLCRAAQTSHSWRTVCEDSRLWREKCWEDGLLDEEHTINSLMKKRIFNKHVKQEQIVNKSLQNCDYKVRISNWKIAYLKYISILRNWRTRSMKLDRPLTDTSSDTDPNRNNNFNNVMPNITDSVNNNDNNEFRSPSKHIMQLRCHEESVITCLQYNPKTETIVSGSDDQTLKVWCGRTGKCINTLEGHAGGVWSSQLSPDDIVISGSTDRTLKVWQAHTGKLLHSLHGHTSTVRCLALDGEQVVSGSRDTTLRIWNITRGECLHVLTGHTAAVRCVEFKNNIVISGAYDHLVVVWDAKTGHCCHALQRHVNKIYSLQFDGKTIASGSLDATICIWDAKSGKLRHHLEGHQSLTSKLQLKGNLLVSANADSFCKVWNIKTGQCLHTLGGKYKHDSAITSVYFNSRHVVTSGDDGTVKLWNIKTGEFIRNIITLPTATNGGVVWRIRASLTKLICAVGSRLQTEETHLLVLDFNDEEDRLQELRQ